jgi:hypothetical protein
MAHIDAAGRLAAAFPGAADSIYQKCLIQFANCRQSLNRPRPIACICPWPFGLHKKVVPMSTVVSGVGPVVLDQQPTETEQTESDRATVAARPVGRLFLPPLPFRSGKSHGRIRPIVPAVAAASVLLAALVATFGG